MLQIDHLAIQDFVLENFSLKPGEIVALTGPSGSGKTRLLRAIADLDPNDGQMRLDSVERAEMAAPDWRAKVRFVAATPAWWRARVRDHLVEPRTSQDMLKQLNLPAEAIDWPVDRLSTGEAQRVAIARALSGKPKILLLDEPTSGLDDDTGRGVEKMLRLLAANGVAQLVTTHNRAQAKRLAKREIKITKAGVRIFERAG